MSQIECNACFPVGTCNKTSSVGGRLHSTDRKCIRGLRDGLAIFLPCNTEFLDYEPLYSFHSLQAVAICRPKTAVLCLRARGH